MAKSPTESDGGKETSIPSDQNPSLSIDPSHDDWSCYKDDDIMLQQAAIQSEVEGKSPLVGDKEPLSALAAEYETGNPIIREKIKLLSEQYGAIRRTRGDGNCFFRAFMFSYLEHILETQNRAEVDRIHSKIEQCKKTLLNLGYADFTFEDFLVLFVEQLDSVLQGNENSIGHDELLQRSRDPSTSNYVVMFFRFVTSGEIQRRSEFFEPFILGLSDVSVDQFCKTLVEPMGTESDHVQIIALSDAFGVPIRVAYLDRSSCNSGGTVHVNHHDFIPWKDSIKAHNQECGTNNDHSMKPFVTLLYRPGHYDILYPN